MPDAWVDWQMRETARRRYVAKRDRIEALIAAIIREHSAGGIGEPVSGGCIPGDPSDVWIHDELLPELRAVLAAQPPAAETAPDGPAQEAP